MTADLRILYADMSPQPPLPPTLRWTWRDHVAGVAAETVARAWLGPLLGRAPDEVPMRRDDHGRPRLQPPCHEFDAGWSHSGEGLVVAFGRGLVLGIDLEWTRPRPNALALARRFFATPEADWLHGLAEPVREASFLRLWCAKEAILKAHGHGLSFGLARVVFADRGGALVLVACDPALGAPGDWRLHEWSPRPGYRAALAWRETPCPPLPEDTADA